MSRTGRWAGHWDAVYGGRVEDELTWFEARPGLSLDLIEAYGDPVQPVVDIGAGVSRLVDHLLAAGFSDVTALDLSQAALDTVRGRLGADANNAHWVAGDVTTWRPEQDYRLWHDRAVFHFLTEDADRAAYVGALQAALQPGGYAIIATFADDGPEKCSGLPVVRYAPQDLASELDRHAPGGFDPVAAPRFDHVTPKGTRQKFQVSVFRKST